MTQKTEEPTLVNSESAEKTVTGVVTLTPKRSKKRTGTNLTATWQGTKPLLLAILDKAQENGLPVEKMNIDLDGQQVACIVLPTQQWKQAGKYLSLEDVPCAVQK